MEASTTIRQMMISGNTIKVPDYQRAYSWETPTKNSTRKTHVDVFLSDIIEYINSTSKSRYYFGHFLFEKSEGHINIIDGQQRLTTIIICISAIFKKINSLRSQTDWEKELFEDIIRRNKTIRFSTVEYDDLIFKDYIINQTKKDTTGLETESAKRIVNAFNYFTEEIHEKDEATLIKILESISNASCSTHEVKDESESIQMFIFQNNRGKKPSNLEIIKAQFMYAIHLCGGEEKNAIISEIKKRFENIYKHISLITYDLDEDDVLAYTMRIYYNSLTEPNTQKTIAQELLKPDPLDFIKSFVSALAISFEKLRIFFQEDEKTNMQVHSLISLGSIGVALPFIIKAYSFNLDIKKIGSLCASLESLILRNRLIGTRADISTRINDVFKGFSLDKPSIQQIIDRIEKIKNTTDDWWAYWNNAELERALQFNIDHRTAKFLLWKYENNLQLSREAGYRLMKFNDVKSLELEHIAPSTEPQKKPHGYDIYDEEFVKKYINCLGNYLLTSKSHNASLSNDPFSLKHPRYTELEQQKEIQKTLQADETWNRTLIKSRKEKIINFLMTSF